MKLYDLLDAIVLPTVYLSKDSESKWVRAAGQIGVIIPMLPWTIVVLVFGLLVIMPAWLLVDLVYEWWTDV